jgi:rhodanese-related sulfurtransferase
MKPNTISVPELRAKLEAGQTIQLIDVRSPGEFAAGHVPGAINIPLEQIEVRLPDIQHAPIALLCQSGRRAGMACEVLAGHRPDLMVVEGGTQAWISAGLPIVSSAGASWPLERQVRLIAGLMVLLGTVLAVTVAPAWIYLAMVVGAGLTVAGLTGWCGMALLLAKLPWNRPQSCRPRGKEAIA